MSRLRFPLKDSLQDPVDESAIHRVAQRIDERSRPTRSWKRPLPVLVGGMALGLAILAGVHIGRRPEPLRLRDGGDVVTVVAETVGREIHLADGSTIQLSPGTRFEPLESSGTRFSGLVSNGRADFVVQPGGQRLWVIECGLATVEVLGTAFTCERTPGHLQVRVQRGIVLVRGDRVPDRARRLTAGQSIDVEDTGPSTHAEFSPSPLDAAPEAKERPNTPEPPSTIASRSPTPNPWRELARRGKHNDAFAALGKEGLRREARRVNVADLLDLADVARLSGHPEEAVEPLQRILTRFPADPHAPLAAFTLGRVHLDSLGHAHAAAAAFQKALDLGIPRGLREDALARLVEAHSRDRNQSAATRAAETYRREFPSGRHAQAVDGWLHR